MARWTKVVLLVVVALVVVLFGFRRPRVIFNNHDVPEVIDNGPVRIHRPWSIEHPLDIPIPGRETNGNDKRWILAQSAPLMYLRAWSGPDGRLQPIGGDPTSVGPEDRIEFDLIGGRSGGQIVIKQDKPAQDADRSPLRLSSEWLYFERDWYLIPLKVRGSDSEKYRITAVHVNDNPPICLRGRLNGSYCTNDHPDWSVQVKLCTKLQPGDCNTRR